MRARRNSFDLEGTYKSELFNSIYIYSKKVSPTKALKSKLKDHLFKERIQNVYLLKEADECDE